MSFFPSGNQFSLSIFQNIEIRLYSEPDFQICIGSFCFVVLAITFDLPNDTAAENDSRTFNFHF